MYSYIILGAVALIAFYLWATYNGLITAKTRVEESWSGIDVQLKRRASLIPNLVETVKGYASHEKGIFEEVTKARSALVNASTPREKAEADNTLTGTLKTLFAVAENYPDLKANQNFMKLQEELADAEDKVAYARQFYNTNVMEYNIKLKVFPSVLVANMFSFKAEEFFEAEEGEREDVEVSFKADQKANE
ncbi:LemA family protein [Patescibacteria group bacterium]|nr:LemA family protein [Patescibacteria group bacterium]MBU1868456.1 LemA family protein [Patescibacteria group bacterium]